MLRSGYNASDKHLAMESLVNSLKHRKSISMKDLSTLYNYINHKDLPANTFGKLAAGYLPKPETIREGAERFWGIRIDWQEQSGLFD